MMKISKLGVLILAAAAAVSVTGCDLFGKKSEAPAQQAQQLNGGPQDDEADAAGVPGGSVGATPGDVRAQAEAYAQQLLSLPDSQRRGLLIKIKQSNPTLHDQVMGIMNDIRSQARSQGGAMMLEQMKGQM